VLTAAVSQLSISIARHPHAYNAHVPAHDVQDGEGLLFRAWDTHVHHMAADVLKPPALWTGGGYACVAEVPAGPNVALTGSFASLLRKELDPASSGEVESVLRPGLSQAEVRYYPIRAGTNYRVSHRVQGVFFFGGRLTRREGESAQPTADQLGDVMDLTEVVRHATSEVLSQTRKREIRVLGIPVLCSATGAVDALTPSQSYSTLLSAVLDDAASGTDVTVVVGTYALTPERRPVLVRGLARAMEALGPTLAAQARVFRDGPARAFSLAMVGLCGHFLLWRSFRPKRAVLLVLAAGAASASALGESWVLKILPVSPGALATVVSAALAVSLGLFLPFLKDK
jgi:hypothetical protein